MVAKPLLEVDIGALAGSAGCGLVCRSGVVAFRLHGVGILNENEVMVGGSSGAGHVQADQIGPGASHGPHVGVYSP